MTEQARFAAALCDPALPAPGGLRVWNGSDPAARFANIEVPTPFGDVIGALGR